MDDLATRRITKQPLNFASAGSTFKRPTGYFAGKLIEETGLRGLTLRGAQVSEKHCGFNICYKKCCICQVWGYVGRRSQNTWRGLTNENTG